MEGELAHHLSPSSPEEDEFLRRITGEPTLRTQAVNEQFGDELAWQAANRRQVFSSEGSRWLASGWGSSSLPDYSDVPTNLVALGGPEVCFPDPVCDELNIEAEQLFVPHPQPIHLVDRTPISDSHNDSARLELTPRRRNSGNNVNFVAAVAVGLVAVSFAMGLAQSRTGTRTAR